MRRGTRKGVCNEGTSMRAYNNAFMAISKQLKRLASACGWTSALLGVVLLSGCADKPAPFNSMDVTGADWGQVYSLPDLDGQRREPSDFQGKVTAVFFGFLYCPDACPNHLTKMLALKERLGADADKLQVVFVTVDPERDEPKALKTFLTSFDPSFIGLRGSAEETDKTAKDFRVYFKKVPGLKANDNPMSYTIDHTTFSYLFDPSGSLRLVVPHDLPLDQLVTDVQALLRGPTR
jgi:protein SCO1